VHFGVSATRVDGLTTEPVIAFQDAVGLPHEIHCRYLVGADGSHSLCRRQIPENARRQYFREYPFAWFGIIAQAPRSAPELIYNQSERGFALISQRTATVQRMYFQCDPDTDVAAWSDDRIWDEIQARLAPNGHQVVEGPILDKTVLGFRSFVNEPMQYGRMLLAGDAAHTVPPTGAKGLNLALADAAILAEVLEKAIRTDDPDVSAEYSPRALRRVWRATHFSYWMTTMLHRLPGMSDFDVRRQTAELESLTASPAGRTFLAEGYTGLTGQVN
jgi:p-hydroxybenzoate 3-monooxygenase